MSFECAVTHDGVRCAAKDQGDTTYLGLLTFCVAHQEVFEADPMVLAMEIVNAKAMRMPWVKKFIESTASRAPQAQSVREDATSVQARSNASVYFLRCEGFMKIGYASDPLKRLNQIRSMDGTKFPEGINIRRAVLVTTEDGGYPREQLLHAKFSHLRHTGEWFTEMPELTEYIDSLTTKAA